jgi:hypothetical protein
LRNEKPWVVMANTMQVVQYLIKRKGQVSDLFKTTRNSSGVDLDYHKEAGEYADEAAVLAHGDFAQERRRF